MVAANIEILKELRCSLDARTGERALRELVTTHREAFSRNRKLPLGHVVGMLINQPKRSLSVEVREFFDSLGQSSQQCTKGAFSLQRSKLSPLFFQAWNKYLIGLFYHHYGQSVKRWRSFIVQAVDGSAAYLVHQQKICLLYTSPSPRD